MGNLILNSLEIRNFRGFQDLKIERLGRVNLIVGKNNIGKSSLLEALQLYARRGSPEIIWEILKTRDENRQPVSRITRRIVKIEDLLASLRYLFYGRKEIKGFLDPITIGPINSPEEELSITVGWYPSRSDDAGNRTAMQLQLLQPEEYSVIENPTPRFVIQIDNQPKINYPLRVDPSNLLSSELEEIGCVFVSADGLNRDGERGIDLVDLWDGVALTPLENEVLNSLRIIAPGVEGLNFLGDTQSVRLETRRDVVSYLRRIPTVRVVGIDEPIPLRSLGDGMQRMLGIILALVNAKDGMLLIDEIENGIHYSVQPDLWRLIFQLAHRLNVQVFATTHSRDCIEGFQEAAQENTQEEGMLIRLSVKGDEVIATLFDERKLGIANREQIEVR
ncbi:MAG TPA: AAA family ATPase [Ktedonobacteraceae bacterium]|nr:AAA family ATPase [Ktedonobacteraceae bacterium]